MALVHPSPTQHRAATLQVCSTPRALSFKEPVVGESGPCCAEGPKSAPVGAGCLNGYDCRALCLGPLFASGSLDPGKLPIPLWPSGPASTVLASLAGSWAPNDWILVLITGVSVAVDLFCNLVSRQGSLPKKQGEGSYSSCTWPTPAQANLLDLCVVRCPQQTEANPKMSKSGLGLAHIMESLEQQKARQGTRTQTRVAFLYPLSKAVLPCSTSVLLPWGQTNWGQKAQVEDGTSQYGQLGWS